MIEIKKITKNIINNIDHIRYGNLKNILKDIPIHPRNYSIYENKWVDDLHIRYVKSIQDALCEIPILKRRTPVNEITIQNIPININTKPTYETIEYVIKNSILTIDDINPVFYKNKTNKDVAMFILIACKMAEADDEFSNILKLFKDCGYYLATNDVVIDENNEKYILSLIEPYWPDVDLIRFPEYVYHITPYYNKDNIDINGFIPKSEAEFFDGPDRIYFFMSDDRNAMYNHIRHSKKLKCNPIDHLYDVVIYKIKTSYDMRFYLDTRTFDKEENLIEDCIYSYEPISANNIDSYEIVNMKTIPININ